MDLYMYDHHGEKGPSFSLPLVLKDVFQRFDYHRLFCMKIQTKHRRVWSQTKHRRLWSHQTISYYNNATQHLIC